MRKKDLLGIIEKSILKNDVSTQDLYENYFHLVTEVLRPFKAKTKIEGLGEEPMRYYPFRIDKKTDLERRIAGLDLSCLN